ncbi:MAG: hypothetical protein ABSF50_19610 [Burkholderiaceae bacterium]|jgi:hypothetical protein
MNDKPILPRPHAGTTVAAAALSSFIAIGLLTAVVGLFERDGTPFEQVVVAEHACASYEFVSERAACTQLFLAAARVRNVASR